MPIPVLPTTASRVVLVYCDDPSVRPSDSSAYGWILEGDAACEADATRVTVRPLNTDERSQCSDAGGFNRKALARARAGVLGVDGVSTRKAVEAFLAGVHEHVVLLLGLYIGDITDGRDPNQARYKPADSDAIVTGDDDEPAEGD